MIFGKLFRKKKKVQEEERKIECTEYYTDEELKNALIKAIDSAKKEIIIITDDFSEFK